MKVFVYSKKTNAKIAQVNNVNKVDTDSSEHQIRLTTTSNETFTFNTSEIKTTVYQN